MGVPNLALRGSIYWWRRRITVCGHSIPLDLSLRTGLFYQAKVRALHLSAEVEKLRMAYGERGDAIDAATLKKIFSDAMRWQLQRILVDQTASGVHPDQHAWTNRAFAEMWRIFARDGQWTGADEDRLAAEGWPPAAQRLVGELWQQHHGRHLVSAGQLKTYEERFGFAPTASNLDRVRRVILSARAEACEEATKRLGSHPADFSSWVDGALGDESPFAFEPAEPVPTGPSPAPADNQGAHQQPAPSTRAPDPAAAAPHAHAGPKKLLKDASEECIAEYERANAWSADSVEQVRAAIRLFDFACGEDVAIEDLTQQHVEAFHKLCGDLPNRWGKTKAELERGLPASLEYAETLKANGQAHRIGFSSKTKDKHITWIQAVLAYADNEGLENGHRPAVPLRFKTKRLTIGNKAESKQQRKRDARANWTRKEIGRLLKAPIWFGCLDLDHRFIDGEEIFHDAWYWLPLMYVLYGGRSSELAGLPLADVFETDEIPFFKVDYHDLRGLKNVQSVRRLPVHPELIRLGFIEYVAAMRQLDHRLLFPEMYSPNSQSFAATFYRSVFRKWRAWAFPDGTTWRHVDRGQTKDKDVHSFRGVASSLMKGKIADSVRFDILGHEGENTTQSVYDEEAELEEKLKGLVLVSPLTEHLSHRPLQLRPADRQQFGARRGRPKVPGNRTNNR